MASECSPIHALGRNPGMVLGVILGEAFKQHKDKLTIIADPETRTFWDMVGAAYCRKQWKTR